LLDGLDRVGAPEILAETGWHERIVSVADSSRRRLRGTLGPQVGLLDGLAPCLHPGTVIVKDSTISAYMWGNRLLPVRRPRTSITSNSFAIGLGLPQALGAAVGSKEAPVVLLAGGGGFLLAATELATVAQEQLPIVALILRRRRLRNSSEHPGSPVRAWRWPDRCGAGTTRFLRTCNRVRDSCRSRRLNRGLRAGSSASA